MSTVESAPGVPVLDGHLPAAAAGRIAFVLARPAHSGNIGAALRALTNFGFADLRVAAMTEPFDREQAGALAVSAKHKLDRLAFHDTVPGALADCVRVFAVTRRKRKHRYAFLSARGGAAKVWEATARGRVALLFGCEADGLSNDEVALAQELIAIPTADEMGSLNLAQAVLLLSYELFTASAQIPEYLVDTRLPPAPQPEIEQMLQHMERALWKLGYVRESNPEIVGELRQIFGARELTQPWVRILRGIFTRIDKLAARTGMGQEKP